jgi:hypothetical protein
MKERRRMREREYGIIGIPEIGRQGLHSTLGLFTWYCGEKLDPNGLYTIIYNYI